MSQSYDRISLWGIAKYANPHVLDGLHVPDRFDADDIQNIKDNILLESAELELYYTDPTFLQSAIEVWSRKMVYNWDRIMDALLAEYSPIENFDRYEEWSDTGSGSRVRNNRGTSSTAGQTKTETEASSEGQSQNNISSVSNGENNTEQVVKNTGMNDPTTQGLVTHDKTEGSTVNMVADQSNSATNSASTNNSTNDTTTSANGVTTDEEVENHTTEGGHEGHLHGNIGVTTNQQMIEAEVELRRKYNMIDIIVNDFIDKFCLRVY